jgi:hypothetical protein
MKEFQIFTAVTEKMSMSKQPTLSWVLPMYLHMENEMNKALLQKDLDSHIKHGIRAAIPKLLKYYNMAKENRCNILATSKIFYSKVSYY